MFKVYVKFANVHRYKYLHTVLQNAKFLLFLLKWLLALANVAHNSQIYASVR